MMKVAFITRSTLFAVPGGDTVQVTQTARQLNELGLMVEIKLANEQIDYNSFDLLHFFNITRPADILLHSQKAGKPFVVSTILCNYSEYDKYQSNGLRKLLGMLPASSIDYVKTVARWLLGKDHLASPSYLWRGQRNSILQVLRHAALILPNSASEYQRVMDTYSQPCKYNVIPNGIDPALFEYQAGQDRDKNLVLCVARVEGIKNQLNLIKALNNSKFNLLIIGSHAPNQAAYYKQCRDMAAANITFIDHVAQTKLLGYYRQAKVHILPSWFETTGLSSIEAAAMGCNIVITDKGDTREYFGDDAFYCEPGQPQNILATVEAASKASFNEKLRQRILKQFTWKQAALKTYQAYQLAYSA
jgi:glycosyltransferase involved in cell wall biosynthesis